jgi:hypothetical protein
MQFSIETDRFLAVSDASYIKHDDVYGIIKHHLYSDKAVWYSNELRLSHGCALIKCKQLGYALLTLETEEEYGCFQVYLKRHHDLFDDFTHYGAHLENFTSNDEWKWSANGEKMKFAPQWGNLHPNGNERCVVLEKTLLTREPPFDLQKFNCDAKLSFFCASKVINSKEVWEGDIAKSLI